MGGPVTESREGMGRHFGESTSLSRVPAEQRKSPENHPREETNWSRAPCNHWLFKLSDLVQKIGSLQRSNEYFRTLIQYFLALITCQAVF